MEVWEIILTVFGAFLSLVVGIILATHNRKIEKKLDEEAKIRAKQEAERAEREKSRHEYERNMIHLIFANIALGEANATAMQNGKCNGETHRALDYVHDVKTELREFLYNQGIDHLF